MTDDNQRFERANRLDVIIKSLKYNGKSFAESIDVSQSMVSNVLNGKRAMTLEFVEKITQRHSNVNPSWLLYDSGEMFLDDVPDAKQPEAPEQAEEYSVLPLNIITIRQRWKCDQEGFGNMLSATRNQVSNWERGRTEPDYESLCRLEALTGISQKRIRSQELSRGDIPEFPLLTQPLLHETPDLSEVYAIQKEILQRVAAIEEILRKYRITDRVGNN